jgi:hypothetical protein
MSFRHHNNFVPSPGTTQSLLRRVFVEDWSLKLLALAITLVLWFMVSGRDIEREVAVEPRIEGQPAPSCEVREVVATPSSVRVIGPASHVNALQKAPTETISIEGRRDSFDAPKTAIRISDSKVSVRDTVNVHVTIVAVEKSQLKPRETN